MKARFDGRKDNVMNKFDFRGRKISYQWNWLDDDTFIFQFGDGEFEDLEGDYFIHFEYHVADDEWLITIWREDDNININELDKCDADEYITETEIEEVKKIARRLMN